MLLARPKTNQNNIGTRPVHSIYLFLMVKEFGLRIKKLYIQFKWKFALKQWLNHNPEPIHRLSRQLNKINYELRQIKRSKKAL